MPKPKESERLRGPGDCQHGAIEEDGSSAGEQDHGNAEGNIDESRLAAFAS